MFVIAIFGTIAIACAAAVAGQRYGVEYIIGAFAGSIVVVAAIANKLITVGPFTVSAAVVVFSVTFLLTDVISEFWGKAEARKAVWAGFLADVLFFFSIWVTIQLEPSSFWSGQAAFEETLGSTGRIVLASVVAYVIAQSHDVWAYHLLKEKFSGKYLWLRNNISTGISQIIDSVVFVTIAFLGVAPILPIIVGTTIVKFFIAALDTPFLYVLRWYYKRSGGVRN